MPHHSIDNGTRLLEFRHRKGRIVKMRRFVHVDDIHRNGLLDGIRTAIFSKNFLAGALIIVQTIRNSDQVRDRHFNTQGLVLFVVKICALVLFHGHKAGLRVNLKAAARILGDFKVQAIFLIKLIVIKPSNRINRCSLRGIFLNFDSFRLDNRFFISVENLNRDTNVVIHRLE